jgi:hypothetical protein
VGGELDYTERALPFPGMSNAQFSISNEAGLCLVLLNKLKITGQ